MSPADSRRIWIIGAIIALLTLTTLVAVQARQRVIKKQFSAHPRDTNDFDRWMRMVPAFLHQHVNYVNDLFPTAPNNLVILAPFTWVSPANAQFIWVYCKLIFVVAIFWFAMNMLQGTGVQLHPAILALILATWFWPIIGDMQEGQINLLMLLPLAAGLWAAGKQTRPMDYLAGFMIGLAICIKVTPLIFIPYFIYRRRWKVALATVLGVCTWFVIMPSMVFGPVQALTWIIEWIRIMITPYVVHGTVRITEGESIPSFVTRLLRHVPAFKDFHHGAWQKYYVNVVNLPAALVDWLVRFILLAIVGAMAWWGRKPIKNYRGQQYLKECGCVTAFMLWASAWTWVPHYVTLIFALFAAGMIASDLTYPEKTRRLATWALILAAVLMLFTSDIVKIFGPEAPNYSRTFDPVLLLSAVIVFAIMRSPRKDAPAIDPARVAAVPAQPPLIGDDGNK